MNPTMRLAPTLAKLAAVVVIAVLLFIIVINAMRSPVDSSNTRGYSAEFTDVSGLHVNGDVRTKGLRIGKVTAVDLSDGGDGQSVATVKFTLDAAYRLTDKTKLAIKYLNLTGVRYIDLTAEPGKTVDHLGYDVTTPSFDITELFNGLQPVLTTMNTEQINAFTQNAITLLQGDGNGLGPMLRSASELADFAQDREQVISSLVANMKHVADTMGGRSPQVMDFLQSVSIPIGKAMTVLDEFPKTAATGPEFLTPVRRLLQTLGIESDLNIDQLLTTTFHSMGEAASAIRLLPGAFAGLKVPQLVGAAPSHCNNGIATLPTDVQVLLSGSEVTVCKPA